MQALIFLLKVQQKCNKYIDSFFIFWYSLVRKGVLKMTFKRLPNGFGNISKLSGKRRRPFIARKNGVIVGYFQTWDEAHTALARIVDKEIRKRELVTFQGVYAAYIKERYGDDPNVNAEPKKKYRAANNYCKPLWTLKMADITVYDIEDVRDNPELPRTVKGRVKQLLDGMFSYAIRHDLIEQNPQEKVLWKIDNSTKLKRKMMTLAEMTKLIKSAKPSEAVEAVLFLLYTGVRPGELCKIKTENVNIEERKIFIEGTKTQAAERTVPIHKAILDRVRFQKEMAVKEKRETLFSFGTDKTLRVKYRNELPDLSKEHELYDLRHQWFSQCKLCNVNELVVDLIGGHKPKSLTNNTYTHLDTEDGWRYILTEFSKFGYGEGDRNLPI